MCDKKYILLLPNTVDFIRLNVHTYQSTTIYTFPFPQSLLTSMTPYHFPQCQMLTQLLLCFIPLNSSVTSYQDSYSLLIVFQFHPSLATNAQSEKVLFQWQSQNYKRTNKGGDLLSVQLSNILILTYSDGFWTLNSRPTIFHSVSPNVWN